MIENKCEACSGTGRVFDGEECGFCKPTRPVLFADVCAADANELRDIAEYFETRGKPLQGKFLRSVADRHDVLAGAYSTASNVRRAAFNFFAWFNKTYPAAPSRSSEHPWNVLGSMLHEWTVNEDRKK